MRSWGFFGYHGTDGERKTFELMLLTISAKDTRFETTVYNHLYIDEAGDYYIYRGTKNFKVVEGNHYKITGTIKHKTYKGKKYTFIQRLKYGNL